MSPINVKKYFGPGLTRRVLAGLLMAVLLLPMALTARAAPGNKIILIGGKASHRPGEHDFPHAIQFIDALLKQSPDLQNHAGLVVEAHPYGWPSADAFAGAATVVLYFDGAKKHPLLDPVKRKQLEKLMDLGVGLVALHQAITLPENNTSVPLLDWLGGARYGKADSTVQPAKLSLPPSPHALTRGLETFVHFDEFYPTVRFNKKTGKLTPIWRPELQLQWVKGVATADTIAEKYTVAWAFERENGGRSFAYSGGHFVAGWDKIQPRTLLLNAILWTAGRDIPAMGVTSTAPSDAAARLAFPERAVKATTSLVSSPQNNKIKKAVMSPPQDNRVVEYPWGHITWLVSGALQNSSSLTTGLVTILAGKSNPRHFHPNCDEVLHVLKGRILHTMDDVTVEMKAGDTVSIPKGVHHNATPVGSEDAEMTISYSSAWREVIGE